MKWPDGIGRGSWDWENPRQESANQIPALPVLTGHAIRCPRSGGSGSAPLGLLLNTIYTYIYIYIYIFVNWIVRVCVCVFSFFGNDNKKKLTNKQKDVK